MILDIFATHARTHEAMLQVELAQLMYFRTRLKRMWTHLERLGGGGTGGLGAGRGPGEKQLETDRRLVDRRISELKHRLREVESRRERTVSLRRDQPTVSLVGYTNAGKSTLMRSLTGADVLVEDKLFATLDTRTRRWAIPGFGDVLLSDTVGLFGIFRIILWPHFGPLWKKRDMRICCCMWWTPAARKQNDRFIRSIRCCRRSVSIVQTSCWYSIRWIGSKISRLSMCCGDIIRIRSRSVLRPETVWTDWQQLSPNGCQAVS